MGFEHVHDLIGGRAAWTALGLPTEGEVGDRRRIGGHTATAATVGIGETVSAVHALGPRRFPIAVVDDHGVLLGALDPGVASLPADTPVERAMDPAPGTIRPEMRIEEVVEQLRSDGLDHVFVTAVNGVLIGMVVTGELHV
jgi:Mg/Co/Ni transporter MgtE